ncbi:hypothetical protein NXC12_PA00095 (plasmid) [Rhizobium etli]|uniref:Uncharacterized protein n=1 Tax=Rhizobium etli TaxID=29449 RepID=A0AAN1BL08_RHIET|nr:hypothetical protein REMIM1_PA00097 [Rhizobium etli bv. mimosae str. Mim1]ARQ12332.1 hypothetical protein NXC12_PA00095 [Rhizobium etli]
MKGKISHNAPELIGQPIAATSGHDREIDTGLNDVGILASQIIFDLVSTLSRAAQPRLAS